MITISQAETPEDLDAVRDLVRAFVRWAMAEIDKSDNPGVFAGLETELAQLPGRYGPPGGGLALARLDGAPAGSVAFFDRGNAVMEIKRMFVAPTARGHGIWRADAGPSVDQGASDGSPARAFVDAPFHAFGPCSL